MRGSPRFFAGLACFFVLLALYSITSRADLQLSDETAVFASAISLESKGDLSIDELQWLHDCRCLNFGKMGREGHLYSKYFPGNAVASAIIYRLTAKQPDIPYFWKTPPDLDPPVSFMKLAESNFGARSVLRLNALLGALGMTALFVLLLRYFDWRVSVFSLVLTALCSDWWYQSRGYLSEVGAGALLIACLCAAAYGRPFQSGFALGLSLLFRPTNLLGAPVWFKSVLDRKGAAIWSGLGILAGILGLALFNWLRFGSVFDFGYGQEGFSPGILTGLFVNLLSPGRSLFVYSPVLLLAIPGAGLFWKKDRSLALVAVVTVVLQLLLVSAWHTPDGGWTWGSRLMTPVLPILGFLTAPVLEQAWNRRGDILVIFSLTILGFAIQTAALARDPVRTLVDRVVYQGLPYDQTIFSPRHAWVVLQFQYLEHWQKCDLDSYTLREWIGACPVQEVPGLETSPP